MKARTRVSKILFPHTPHGVRKREFRFLMTAMSLAALACLLLILLLWSWSKLKPTPRAPEAYGEERK
jgi:hypothetical protein